MAKLWALLKHLPAVVWFTKLRHAVHVHGLPLVIGAGVGLAFLEAQQSGTITINVAWMANEHLLATVCSFASVCLDASEGPLAISTLMLGSLSALIADRLYLAECPKYPWLAKVNDAAEELVGKVPCVELPSNKPAGTVPTNLSDKRGQPVTTREG